MKVYKFILVLLVLFCLNAPAFCQDRFIQKYRTSMYFGFREIKRDSFPNTENIDFMNYLYSNKKYAETEYLGGALHLWLRNNWEVDAKIAVYDEFIPNNFNISVQKFPFRWLGFTVGMQGYPQHLDQFTAYHDRQDIQFHKSENEYRQVTLYDIGAMAGPAVRSKIGILDVMVKLQAGWSTFLPFKENVSQKKINSNLRRQIEYRTEKNGSLFFFPEAELSADCFKLNKTVWGLRVYSSYYRGKRSIDYTQTVREWTATNSTTKTINSPDHIYQKFDIDFGIFCRW